MKTAIIIVLVVAVIGLTANMINTKNVDVFNTQLSQFSSVARSNEWVVATLKSSESLSIEKYRKAPILDLPLGDAMITYVVPATYKYYVVTSELNFTLTDRTLWVISPQLYLQTPVAFDTKTMKLVSASQGISPDLEQMKKEVFDSISSKLIQSGRMQRSIAKLQAYESLAMNVHDTLVQLGESGFYDEIVVEFTDTPSEISRRFSFDNGFCSGSKCNAEFSIGNKVIYFDVPKF